MTWKPTGQATFIAKEVLTNKLQQYMSLVLSNEAAMQKVDLRELLEQVWDAMDVGKESPVLSDEDLQKQGQGQLPPEIQEQMLAAKEEYDALVQEHQGMQQENQKIQQDNQSLQMQLKDKAMGLMEEQRQFNEKMQFEQQKLLLELQGKNTEAERAALIKQHQSVTAEETKRFNAQMGEETKRFNVQLAEETKRVIAGAKILSTADNGASEEEQAEELAKQQQTEQTEIAETEQRRVSSEKMDALVGSIQKLADKMEPGKSTSHRKLKLRKLPDGSMDVDVVDE